MTVVCASLGVTKPTTQQIKDLMKKFEKENKGKISFDEYISFLKITIKRHLEKLEGFNEENLRNLQKKDDNNEKLIRKQIFKFEKYLEDSGVALAFEVIYTEILANKIEPDKVFMYTAMRLRQIGREIAHLLPKDLTQSTAK